MCTPVGLVLATSALSAVSQQQQARATNDFNTKQAEQTRLSANRSARANFDAVAARTSEARQAASSEALAISRQAIQASGLSRLDAAGASVASGLESIAAQRVQGIQSIKNRSEFGDIQALNETDAARERALGRTLSAQRARVGGGEFVQLALSVGSTIAANPDTAFKTFSFLG